MRTAAASVALLLLAVVGCSADEAGPAEVGPLASGSPSAEATASADAAPGTPRSSVSPGKSANEPAVSHASTVEGASAFAREYVALIGRGFSEANPTPMRERTASNCEGCEALMGAMERAAVDGLRRRGGEYTVTSVATPPFEGGDVLVLLTYVRAAAEIVNSKGDVVDQAPAVPQTTVQMRLVYGSRGWLTQGYRVV